MAILSSELESTRRVHGIEHPSRQSIDGSGRSGGGSSSGGEAPGALASSPHLLESVMSAEEEQLYAEIDRTDPERSPTQSPQQDPSRDRSTSDSTSWEGVRQSTAEYAATSAAVGDELSAMRTLTAASSACSAPSRTNMSAEINTDINTDINANINTDINTEINADTSRRVSARCAGTAIDPSGSMGVPPDVGAGRRSILAVPAPVMASGVRLVGTSTAAPATSASASSNGLTPLSATAPPSYMASQAASKVAGQGELTRPSTSATSYISAVTMASPPTSTAALPMSPVRVRVVHPSSSNTPCLPEPHAAVQTDGATDDVPSPPASPPSCPLPRHPYLHRLWCWCASKPNVSVGLCYCSSFIAGVCEGS